MVVASPLPHDWDLRHLGTLGTWLSGGTPSMAEPNYWGGEIPWVSPKDMKRSRLWDAIDHVTAKALGNGTRLAPAHALLLVVRGMILAHTFPVARAELPVAFNQDIKALVPRDDVDSEYLLWWLTAHESLLLGITTESTHGTKRMPTDALHAVVLAVPQFAEQRAIADALSDVDALLGALDRLIAKKRDLKQAAMQQLLTGQTRLPGFSGEWEVKRLGQICEIAIGRTPPRVSAAFWGEGYAWLSIADLKGKVVSASKEQITPLAAASMQIVPQGTLLMSFKLSIGRLCFAGRDLFTNEAICSITRLQSDPNFLYYQLARVDFSIYGKQAVKGFTLNKESLKRVEVSLPTPAEQSAIAAVLSDMDAELEALEQRRAKTAALKQGMMQELLTGRTRLV